MRNWTAIEALYVQGDMSLRDLAQRQGVSLSALKKRASAQGWSEKRRVYREQTARAEPETGKDGGDLEKLICATEKLTDAALRALNDEEQFCRWIVSDGGGAAKSTEERVFRKIDTKSLKEMAGVLKELTDLTRDFYGLPAPGDAAAARLAEEKLALEKQKLEMAWREAELKRQEDTPEELRVVLAEETEELSE
ncbi:MAG: hypothetical protein IKI69_03125 [Oscillospiraceae bacterium]|nr:hypothetical protein [Oscillospiraceae bacterium]